MTQAWTEGRSRFVALGNTRRHILEWGDPSAPVVLLQHGLLDHAASWSWIAGQLHDRYHVIAPDLRGHGDSDWSPDSDYTLASYVLDTIALADALSLDKLNLVGHSLGGHIALRVAAAFPDRARSLVSIEGVELPLIREHRQAPVKYPARLREYVRTVLRARQLPRRYYADLAEAAGRMAAAFPEMDSETIAHLSRAGVIVEAGSGTRWKYDQACRLRPPEDQNGSDLDEILQEIACPTLLAYGENSWIELPPSSRLKLLRNHRLIEFGNASHWLHHQKRREFCEILKTFLSDPSQTVSIDRTHHA